MKFIPTLFLIFCSLAHAENKIATDIENIAHKNPVAQDIAVATLVGSRCDAYFALQTTNLISAEVRQVQCAKTTAEFMKILAPKVVTFQHPLSGAVISEPVAFPRELLQLMQLPQVGLFLKAWLNSIDAAALGMDKLDTFTLAERYAGSENEALHWMAVILQDTSAARVQVQYLKQQWSKPTAFQMAQIQLLDKVLDVITSIDLGIYSTKMPVLFFPAALEESKNPDLTAHSVYHFYVPGELARRLSQAKRPLAMAMMIPFLFNYVYEAIEETSAFPRLVSEPKKMSSGLRDSYLGYLASAYGTGLKTLPLNDFNHLMATPRTGLNAITEDILKQSPM